MLILNDVVVAGNLTRDARLVSTPGGYLIIDMDLAISDNYKNKTTGEWVKNQHYVGVQYWGNSNDNPSKLRDLSSRLLKGQNVFIKGKISTRQWTEANGKIRHSLDITAFVVKPLYEPPESTNEKEDNQDVPF